MYFSRRFPLQSPEQLGHYLRSLRRRRGLTQRELGLRLGVSGARISEIENDPGVVGLAQLLEMLHVLDARAVLELVNQDSSIEHGGTNALDRAAGEW